MQPTGFMKRNDRKCDCLGLTRLCGGWSRAIWSYVLGQERQFDVWLVQRVKVHGRWHPDCKGYEKEDVVQVEARRLAVLAPGTVRNLQDLDSHPSHGTSFGDHSVSSEVKVLDLRTSPQAEADIKTWQNNPLYPDLYQIVDPANGVPWFDTVAPLEASTRSSYRAWSCCSCRIWPDGTEHDFEGQFVHSP